MNQDLPINPVDKINVRTPWLQAHLMASVGTTNASIAAFFLLFVLAFSLPAKWASLHVAGLALVFATGFARSMDWRNVAARTFLLCTALWLVPVLLTAGLQHALDVATAPAWSELPILVLRMLGIGLGIIILIQRGWLTLHTATLALLCALSLHVGAGVIEWLAAPDASLATWRQGRLDGLVGNPNPFGTFIALTVILAVGLLRDKPHHPYLWALLIAALFCVWASGSRGAILVAATGLVVLFPSSTPKRLFFYLGGAVAATAIYLYSDVQTSATASDIERMKALSFSLEQIRQAPWLGWGIDAYERLPGRVGPAAPHNMLLDLAVSSGLVALAGWTLSTAFLIYQLFRCGSPAAQLALAILAASVLAGTLEYSLLISTHFRGIWVIVTALACCTLGTYTAAPATRAVPMSSAP